MKIKLNAVLQAALAATALTFAGASHAVDYWGYGTPVDLTHDISLAGSSFFGKSVVEGGKLVVSAALISMVDENLSQNIPVYCIEPKVDYLGEAYSLNTAYQVTTGVRKLFESSYASTLAPQPQGSTVTQRDMQFAFQLALWEVTNDDGSLTATTGNQFYAIGSEDKAFQAAQTMLINAQSASLAVEKYQYFAYESQNDPKGQALLGVSAVPEADTWAMMALGLGLLGMVGRRKQNSGKFA